MELLNGKVVAGLRHKCIEKSAKQLAAVVAECGSLRSGAQLHPGVEIGRVGELPLRLPHKRPVETNRLIARGGVEEQVRAGRQVCEGK